MSELRIETTDAVAEVTPIQTLEVATVAPAKWFTGLSEGDKQQVKWAKVAGLKTHTACDFVPFLHRSYAAIRESVEDHGILFPLAVAKNGRVLDGRYRLKAAQELQIETLPVLTIDVDGDEAVDWVFEMREAREHLTEHERAVLAVQHQGRLKDQYVKVRAKAMQAAKKKPKDKKSADKERGKAKVKKDSRKDACDQYKVPIRTFNQMKALHQKRSDLFDKVVSGEMDVVAALKKKGRNEEAERVKKAKELNTKAELLLTDGLENNIHCGDAVEVMKKVPDGVASLVLYSPPYHGVPLEYDPPLPKQTYAEYLDYQRKLLIEAFRVIRRGGRLAIVLDTVRNTEGGPNFMLPVVAEMTRLAIDCGWGFFNDIAWCKGEISGSKTTFGSLGSCSAPMFGRNHETILLFTKDTHKLDGDITRCDLSTEEHLKWWTSEWYIKPEVDNQIRDVHPAPFPEEIPHRLIKMLTFGGDLVIDPYNGSGTTTRVAKSLGRRFIGIDQSGDYCSYARSRCCDSM